MKVKRRDFRLCIAIWLFSMALLFIYSNRTGYWGSYIAGSVNALFSAITLVVVLRCIRECSALNIHSGAEFLLLISAVYNYNSVTKFTVTELYAGYITDTFGRLFGNIYIDIIIIITSVFWLKYHKRAFLHHELHFETIKVSRVAIYIILASFVIAQFVCLRYFNLDLYNFSLTLSVAASGIIMCYIYMVYALCFLYILGGKKTEGISKYIPLAAVFIINLILSLSTGKRNFLILFMFIIVCDFIAAGKIPQKFLEIGCVLSAPVLQLFTMYSFNTSGRIVYFDSYKLAQYNAARYDLSDFAITISHNYFQSTDRLGVIKTAFIEALPKDLFPNVQKMGETVYLKNLYSMGLGNTDYNDTIFSMGAQILGYLGILLLFILFIIYFEWLSKKVLSIKTIGPSLFILIMNYFVMVENGWNRFFSATRDMLMLLVFGFFIMTMIVRRRIKSKDAKTKISS